MSCFSIQQPTSAAIKVIMRRERESFTLDRVRFLGTARRSICKSVGRRIPKSKPPYLRTKSKWDISIKTQSEDESVAEKLDVTPCVCFVAGLFFCDSPTTCSCRREALWGKTHTFEARVTQSITQLIGDICLYQAEQKSQVLRLKLYYLQSTAKRFQHIQRAVFLTSAQNKNI